MAITIAEKPYTLTPLYQKLMVTCTSTQVAQPGFRFVFDVTVSGDTFRIYVVPNSQNRGMLDLHEILKPYVKQSMTKASPNTHFLTGYTQVTTEDIETVSIVVSDGYDVAGVFTVSGSGTATATFYVWAGTLNPYLGYRPDPADSYGNTRCILTNQRRSDMYTWDNALALGFSNGDFFIPVTNEDYGIMSFLLDNGTYFTGNPATWKIRCVIYDSAMVATTTTVTPTITANPKVLMVGTYPMNIQDDGGATWSGYVSDFTAISWQILNGTNDPVTPKYVMYRVENYCKYERLRIGYSQNQGGWDYFNFPLRNEISHEFERRRYRKVLGSYNSSAFTFAVHDRGISEIDINQDSYITATSDWLNEEQFRVLQNLMSSSDVCLFTNGMNSAYEMFSNQQTLAMTVEENSWLERADRSGKKYNVTVKFKFALNQFGNG